MALIPAEPLSRSGVAVLARRWASALHLGGVSARVGQISASGSGPQLPSHVLPVFLGLGQDVDRAQRTVDRVASEHLPLLWERAGYSNAQSGHGLHQLDEVAEAWVLNAELLAETNAVLPAAQLAVAALAIPRVFFVAERRSVSPYAAFLGRFSESKGAGRLAEVWSDTVFPASGLRLVMAGRGFNSDRATERLVARLSAHNPEAIQLIRLMPELSRARFLSDALVTVFPARSDYSPQAMAEAMATGATVIATDIPGHRALAVPGVTSFPVDVRLGDLPAVVDLVRGDPRGASEIATRGRDLIRSTQSVEVTSRRLVELLRGVIAP